MPLFPFCWLLDTCHYGRGPRIWNGKLVLNVDADDATDIISSDSKVLGEGLKVGEKGVRGERGVTGDVIMGLPPMSLLVEALPAGKLLVLLPTYRQTKSP